MPTLTFTFPDGPEHTVFMARLTKMVRAHLLTVARTSLAGGALDEPLRAMPERLTLREIAARLNMPMANFKDAYNLGRALRATGWRPVRARRGNEFVDVWVRA